MRLIKNLAITSTAIITFLILLAYWNIWQDGDILVKLIASIVVLNLAVCFSYLVKNELSSEFHIASKLIICLISVIALLLLLCMWEVIFIEYVWKIILSLIILLIGTVGVILIIRESNKEKKQKDQGYID